MKTWLKLWIVALSLVAMATTIYSSTVKAVDKTVSVTIIEWGNTCTLSDYNFGERNASTWAIALTAIPHTLSCELLKDAWGTITLQLFDLVWANTNATIASGNFSATLSATTVGGSLESENAVNTAMSLWSIQNAYVKWAHKVGTMSRTVTISWTINAWQQVDEYTGTLRVFVPNATN